MRDIPAAEWAKAQLDELVSSERAEQERAVAANQRWVLSLAVGNGGALAAVVTKLIDSKSELIAALMMPSCWFFAIGLLCVGGVAPITASRHRLAVEIWKGYTTAFRQGDPIVGDDEKFKKDKRLMTLELALEWLAAIFFALGLIRPLVILTYRFFTSGEGFFPDLR